MNLLNTSVAAAFCLAAATAFPDDNPRVGKTLSDSFSREELVVNSDPHPWTAPIGGFSIQDGVLHGEELPEAGHGAVARWEVPFQDAKIIFRFRLSGSKQFNFVLDDKNCKESHAGHIARVVFHEAVLRIGDDREGIMRNDIFEMRRAKTTTPEVESILKERSKSVKMSITPNDWHHAQIVVEDDMLRVAVDGGEFHTLKSPGIAHPTKTKFGFTVPGRGVDFDNVSIRILK